MEPYAQLLIILAAMVGFWAIVMRPARNQQKKVHQLQAELQVGDEVILSSGIFGTVRTLTEGRVELEIAPGTVITVARQVVVRRVDEAEQGEGRTSPPTEPGASSPSPSED